MGWGLLGMKGSSKKEKGLMDRDNSVMITGEGYLEVEETIRTISSNTNSIKI